MRGAVSPVRGAVSPVVGRTLCTPEARVRVPGSASIILGVKTWLSTLEIVNLSVFRPLSKVAVVNVGPFYLVSMPGEVKDPTQGVKCVTCRGLHILT